MTELIKNLEHLFEGIVKKTHFKILHPEIQIDFSTCFNNVEKYHSVIFKNVASFYFVKNTGSDRFNFSTPELNDVLSLISIGFYPNGLGKISIQSNNSCANLWHSGANFALEFDVSTLFLEAESISIDGKTYEVGFPQIERDQKDAIS